MTALSEAQKWKAELESKWLEDLKAFTDKTGLNVVAINIRQMNITNLADKHPRYEYVIKLEINI